MTELPDIERRVALVDAVVAPLINQPIDISTMAKFMAVFEAGPPEVEPATNAEAEQLLRTLLASYVTGDDDTRSAVRAMLERYPSFRWVANLSWEPTEECVRLHVLHLSARDQAADPRDEILTLNDLCAKAREAGIEIAPILREVAAISSEVDRYGMGSTRRLLLSGATR